MVKLAVECFSKNNYLSLIILLTIGVLFYVFILQKEVQEEFDVKLYRHEFSNDVLPVWFKTPPDKVVQYMLDFKGFLHKTDKRFLSFSIDSSQIYYGFRNPSLSNLKLRRLVSHLKGGYLRVGGTAADSIVFSPAFRAWPEKELPLDGGFCSFEHMLCPKKPRKIRKFSMNADDWNNLNDFTLATGLKLIFDLNLLLRDGGVWNSSNAELLLDFSFAYHYNVDWQLGNEPNSYRHVYGIDIAPDTLAKDFNSLRSLLSRYKLYNHSLLIGPDITHPRGGFVDNENPVSYLKEFLNSHPDVDRISWHHYYTGPNASLDDYLAVPVYDQFIENCNLISDTVKKSELASKPVWLSETGSSYGGGATNLSDRFVASLLWADKLGAGAKAGLSVIVRQSLYKGIYGLIDHITLTPKPDYWVSVLYKRLIKETVLNLTAVNEAQSTLRVYAHCSSEKFIGIFGVNISNVTQGFYLPLNQSAHFYCLHSSALHSRSVQLNGNTLNVGSDGSLPRFQALIVNMKNIIPIPSFTIFFLQVSSYHPACSGT